MQEVNSPARPTQGAMAGMPNRIEYRPWSPALSPIALAMRPGYDGGRADDPAWSRPMFMSLICPRCSRALEFSGERPSFCAYCGQPLSDPRQAETTPYDRGDLTIAYAPGGVA